MVRDHIPLKQGLRRNVNNVTVVKRSPRPYSIKTRIKTLLYLAAEIHGFVSETIFH